MHRTHMNLRWTSSVKLLLGIVAVGLTGCAQESEAERPGGESNTADRLKVVVSIPPQAYIVERVGGENVETTVLVGSGQSPHSYEPTPKQMAALADSRVYFTIGVQFETQFVERIRAAFKNLEIVDVRDGMKLRTMDAACKHDHGHDHSHDHAGDQCGSAGGKDPHVWLSPEMLMVETRNVLKHLERIAPEHADAFRANAATLLADLETLDAELRERLKPYRGQEFYVFHPAFGYFGDAYGLTQVAVEEEGKEPGPRQVAELISRAKAAGVRLIFVQKQFSDTSARAIAKAIGGSVIQLDPLERNCLENLRLIAERIAEGLRPSASAASQPTTTQAN